MGAGNRRSDKAPFARSRSSTRLLAVGGREFAELREGGGNDFKGGIDFGLGCVAAEAEADAGAGFRGRETDGGEHV